MPTDIILWLFGATTTILGLVLGAMWKHSGAVHKTLFDKVHTMEQAHNDFRVEVAKTYCAKEEMEKLGERLEKALAHGLHEVSSSINTLAQEFHKHQLEERK